MWIFSVCIQMISWRGVQDDEFEFACNWVWECFVEDLMFVVIGKDNGGSHVCLLNADQICS